jgi:hypothetical protein
VVGINAQDDRHRVRLSERRLKMRLKGKPNNKD